MKVFDRKRKQARSEAHSYFGELGEAPVSISLVRATIVDDIGSEPLHLSQAGYKVFVVTEGSLVVEVDNTAQTVDSDHALLIEPLEVHRVLRATQLPCTYVVVGTVKDPTGRDKMELLQR